MRCETGHSVCNERAPHSWRREKQLMENIAARHSELAPMEAELAEVRRAKGALGIPQIVQLSARSVAIAGGTHDSPLPLRSQEQAAHDVVVQIVTERDQTAAVTGALTLVAVRVSPSTLLKCSMRATCQDIFSLSWFLYDFLLLFAL
jgi:hypothetical protein